MSQIKRPISSLKPIPEETDNTQLVEIPSTECTEIPKVTVLAVETKTEEKVYKKQENKRWSQLAAFILWLIVLTIVFWLIFYSLAPTFVLQSDANDVDLSKVLFYSFIFALIILIFVWVIKLCVT